jgi:hypothetical protein
MGRSKTHAYNSPEAFVRVSFYGVWQGLSHIVLGYRGVLARPQ